MKQEMLYLDHAATTFPKPPEVIKGVSDCLKYTSGNPGRGSHRMAMLAAQELYACREAAADFFGADCAERVAFTLNTTHALNMAIKGIVKPFDHVLISDREHNAVLRPVEALVRERHIRYTVFSTKGTKEDILSDIRQKLRPDTRAVIAVHVPNITNTVLPVAEIGTLLQKRGVVFIVDGAQSGGHLPIDVQRQKIDVLCVPGHKGLYGPQGSGMIVCGSDRLENGGTLLEGGSGSHSLDTEMPAEMPERLEAGTMATPAIAGMRAGLAFVKRIGVETIHEKEKHLWEVCTERLSNMDGVCVYGNTPGSVVLFTVDGFSPAAVGQYLNENGICVRTGYHCAPLAHKALGTEKTGGVRASFGVWNTKADALRLADTVYALVKNKSR